MPQYRYPMAKQVTLVIDNLNTHATASLYAVFPPAEAHVLVQCLDRRIPNPAILQTELAAWV